MKSMRSVKYQNSLFIKGVLIVLLPCLLNSAFIFYLNKHWQKAARAALANEQRLDVVLTLNDAFDSFLTFGYDVLTNTFRESRASQYGNEILSLDRAGVDQSLSLPPDAKQLFDTFADIRRDIDNLLEHIESIQFHDGRSRFNSFAGTLKKACVSGSALDTMLQEQSQRSADSALADTKRYSDARVLLVSAIFIEIVLSLFLFLLFVVNIIRRLRILASNAACLNQWSQQPTLSGADELSFLDSIFKDAGARIDAINKLSDERKYGIVKVVKTAANAIKAFLEEIQNNKSALSPEQQFAFNQWVQSANCALARLQTSTASLVGAKVDKRNKNSKVTKKIEPEFFQVEFFDLVELCIQELSPLADVKEVKLVNNCERNIVSVRRDKIILVVMKYLVNALKNAPANTEILVNQAPRDNWINFSVRDSSEALPPSAQREIFNDGTNGLYVCKSIIENEGGKFGVKILGSTGNEFWFALPVVPKKARATFTIDELLGSGADPRYRQEKFIFQSGLFRKAALIVFVPMILHLIVFFWMSQQINDLQQVIDKGHREESLTLTVSSLWLNSFIASSSAALFLTGRDKSYYAQAFAHLARVDQCVADLKNRGGLSPDEMSLIRQTSQFAVSQTNLVKQGMDDGSDISISKTLKLMPTMFNHSAQLSDELNHLMAVESHKTHQATREQVDVQSFMEKVFYCAMLFNFVIAFVLVRFFIVNFINRINGLLIKAEMVADGQPLPVFDNWTDEVDQIQGFLALASKSVEMADESQTAALTLVALEVSSPLDTLDAIFNVIESVPDSEVRWSRELCANVRLSLESAFEQVDQLLVAF